MQVSVPVVLTSESIRSQLLPPGGVVAAAIVVVAAAAASGAIGFVADVALGEVTAS